MFFRPCIDIHNGKVKQIVGGSLRDEGNCASDNFVSQMDAGFYGDLYKKYGFSGGHIIILNASDSDFYNEDKEQAFKALKRFKGGLQVGGGINDKNAMDFINAGASHVIVTSFVFKDGRINYDNLKKMVDTVGKEKLVLDLSCRKKDGLYYIVTDRWQKFTDTVLSKDVIMELALYCDEFLIHAVDVEGKAMGIEIPVVQMLGELENVKVTYAGGISSEEDLKILKNEGKNKVDFTIGSALEIFGGKMTFQDIIKYCQD